MFIQVIYSSRVVIYRRLRWADRVAGMEDEKFVQNFGEKTFWKATSKHDNMVGK
jgi:hypothetical protein